MNTQAQSGRMARELAAERERFLSRGEMGPGVRRVVRRAWERSRAYGLRPDRIPAQRPDEERLAEARARSRTLLEAAEPLLESAHDTLREHPHLLAVADADGVVLRLLTWPEPDTAQAERGNVFEGACWHERAVGCNAVGTALATGEPVLLRGSEHFQEALASWSCIGVPLRHPSGELISALALIVPDRSLTAHTWPLALSFAREMEARLGALARESDARRALRESHARLRAVLDILPVGVWIADADGRLMERNPAAARVWGGKAPLTQRPEEYGEDYRAWWPDGRRLESHEWGLARALQGETVTEQEVEIECYDGTRKWILNYGIPIRHDGKVAGAVALSVDITARREAERALREREGQFRTLADSIPQLAWMADAEGSIFWYNRRWYEYTGTTLEDVEGWGWRSVHHPDHVDRVVERVQRSWDTGEPWEDTFPLRSKEGEYRWFLSRALPIRNERGEVVRWFGTNTDITEQRAAEEALKEARERLEGLYREAREAVRERDEMVGVVSHDLRNPLQTIAAASSFLLETDLPAEKKTRQAAIIRRSVDQMTRLIDDLLDASRIGTGTLKVEREPVNPAYLLQAAAESNGPLAELEGVEVVVEAERMLPSVLADRQRIQQLFSNLIGNALQHTSEGGRVTLRAKPTDEGVRFSVTDTGSGIPRAELPRIFERFWQGSGGRKGRGTGLGLTICRGIVQAHGGEIRVESEEGRGSTFFFTLPPA